MEIHELSWMVGHWQGKSGNTSMEELWLAPDGGLMLGLHRDVFGPDRAFFEYLRIEQKADEITYFASPGGAPATPFLLKELENGRAVFNNPNHDFPKVIIYSRQGEKLTARVEGEQNGQLAMSEWTWDLSQA